MAANVAGNVGQMWADAVTMADSIDAAQFNELASKNARDAWRDISKVADIDPESLRIAAEQMGLPPEVLASRIRGDQLNALRQLQNIGAQGGMDDAAIAANRQAQMASAQQRRGDEQAIQASLQRRGISSGSGAELGMRQNVAQESANRLSQEGLQNAANAQMRALQAINSAGRLAGDIASSDEARMMANRQAAMERDRYNTGIRQAVNQFNAMAPLEAGRFNLARGQGIAGAKISGAGTGSSVRGRQSQEMDRFGAAGADFMNQAGNMAGGFGGM